MSKRKNQNSILVLATLGVYLGLVLVGATPQVLAQAAMARQFNVKDEIEFKDDLDKNPDGINDDTEQTVDEYFRGVYFFVEDLRKIPGASKNSLSFEATIQSPCPATGFYDITGPKLTISKEFEELIRLAQSRASDSNHFASCLPSTRFVGSDRVEARNLIFRIQNDGRGLKYELSIVRRDTADALGLLDEFRKAIHNLDSSDDDVIHAALLRNTVFSAADNQVTITTRLPRAGLDALLASDAK